MDLEQTAAPLAEALNAQRINRLAHFDVPGHKGGRMNPELPEYFGRKRRGTPAFIAKDDLHRYAANREPVELFRGKISSGLGKDAHIYSFQIKIIFINV